MKSLSKNRSPIFTSQDSLFQLYQGDCNELLPSFERQFDLIFADPPYFLSNNGLTIQNGEIVSVNKGEWDKGDGGIDEIDDFNFKWISNAKKALKDTGSILISGTYHNIFSLGRVLQKLDFKILNIITWQKTNPPPNFSCRYLTHSTEQIIWARKSAKHKHIFNYEILKGINTNKQMRDVWTFPAIAPWEKSCGKHPTQKPLSLLVRLILMASNSDSLVCDPFSGSSTTGIASNLLGRKFIGIEKEMEFIKISKNRKLELDTNYEMFLDKISDLKNNRGDEMIFQGKGGANTKTGLIFEEKMDLTRLLSNQKDYQVDDEGWVLYRNDRVGRVLKKNKFYEFLKEKGVDWKKIISAQLLPDNGIYVIENHTFYIIECKSQKTSGSVDEKLQTCDFKKKQYQKLMSHLKIRVEYIYLLDEWFKQDRYRDVLNYITSVECHYYFEYIPLDKLDLPVPE